LARRRRSAASRRHRIDAAYIQAVGIRMLLTSSTCATTTLSKAGATRFFLLDFKAGHGEQVREFVARTAGLTNCEARIQRISWMIRITNNHQTN
jgi:hypothetical protein